MNRAAAGVARGWRAWVALLDRREPATSLAVVRVLVAACLLGDLASVHLAGLVDSVWGPPPGGLGYGAIGGGAPFAVRWLGASDHTAELLWAIATVSSALLLIGLFSRVAAVVLAVTLAQLGAVAPDSERGIDFFLRTVLTVLPFSMSHARFSLDAWIRRRLGRPYPAEVPAWPRYLLMGQLAWVYFSAGMNKSDPAWGPLGGFAALPIILCDPHFARFDPGWVGAGYPLLRVGTVATMAFEYSAPLVLLLSYWHATADRPGRLRRLAGRLRLRWVWIGLGVGFHLGIALTLRLGIFPWGMLALYPVLLHPDELAGLAGRLRRRREPQKA
jgi:uncharacterized membrane protein YphA (DoxX/SURF4 family)